MQLSKLSFLFFFLFLWQENEAGKTVSGVPGQAVSFNDKQQITIIDVQVKDLMRRFNLSF